MKPITIDKLEIKDHVRWAQDQEALESVYVTEATTVAPHPQLVGLSAIYPSKFEELFELQKNNQHWASFCAPTDFSIFGKRFYTYRLFQSIHWDEPDDEEEDTEDEDDPTTDLIQTVMRAQKAQGQSATLFEKDKSAMLNMLESIRWINQLLKQIHARKLQYQKG